MSIRRCTLNAFALAIILAFAAKTQAQYVRNAYVSARGTSATCTLADPCNTVDAALRVVSGGEVVILDSGVFRGFTISSSVTVTAAHGAHPTITAEFDHPAIAVQQGVSAVVRGLRIVPDRSAYYGIRTFRDPLRVGARLDLVIENCVIEHNSFMTGAIWAAGGRLIVKNTTIRGPLGITFGDGECIVDQCWFENNSDKGIHITSSKDRVSLIVQNSTVVNAGTGFSIGSLSTDGPTAQLTIENCTITGSRIGVEVRDALGVAARISNSTITNNDYGFGGATGAYIFSRGNNTVSGNLVSDTGIEVRPLPGT